MRPLAILMTTLLPAGALLAQSAGVWSAPTLGYWYDSEARSLRVVRGVPGAASLDSDVPLGSKAHSATVDPGRRYAFVIPGSQEEGQSTVLLIDLRTGGSRALDGALAASRIALSPSGSAAVLMADSGQGQVWTGLPDAPSLSREVTVGTASAIAISDDAQMIAVARDTGLYLIGEGEAQLAAGDSFSALAFQRDSHTLAAADRGSNQVLLFREGAEAATLAGAPEGVAEPLALSFSGSGERLLIANRAGKSVLVIDVASKRVTPLACDCEPSTMARAQGDAVFQVSEPFDKQIFFIDADAAEPRLFAVFAGGSR
jgi:hypothetical protein